MNVVDFRSLTIPDITVVINLCLSRREVCNPVTSYVKMATFWASKSECLQRAGRAGRVAKGVAFHLVPRAFFNKLEDQRSVIANR